MTGSDPTVRPLSPAEIADDETMRGLYDLTARAERLGREDLPFWTWAEFSAAVRHQDSGERLDVLGAWDDDRLVGVAFCWSFLDDNTDKCGALVDVDPPARRRGIGRALVAAVERRARADGRTLVMLDGHVPYADRDTHPHARFAAACGYRLSHHEVVRRLALPVPDATIDEWAGQAAERHPGYLVQTFVDGVPDDLVPGLCELMGQLIVDAPTGEVDFEEAAMTPARYHERVAVSRASGRIRYETLALTPDRVVAAQSTLAVPVEPGLEVYQWGTFVHRRHRGHRLGLGVKTANLRAVQRDRPDLTSITTQNAETNDHMVAVNVLMGFTPVEVAAEFVKRL